LSLAAFVVYSPKPKDDKRKSLWAKDDKDSVEKAAEVYHCSWI
jgi:hypothetical protein